MTSRTPDVEKSEVEMTKSDFAISPTTLSFRPLNSPESA